MAERDENCLGAQRVPLAMIKSFPVALAGTSTSISKAPAGESAGAAAAAIVLALETSPRLR